MLGYDDSFTEQFLQAKRFCRLPELIRPFPLTYLPIAFPVAFQRFCLIFGSKRNDEHGDYKNGKQFKGQQHVDMENKRGCVYFDTSSFCLLEGVGDYSPFSILAFNSASTSMSPSVVLAATFSIFGVSSFLAARVFLAAAFFSSR